MKKSTFLFALTFMLFCFSSCENKSEESPKQAEVKPEVLIKNCYAGYKKSLLDGDGKTTVEYVNKAGIDYYSAILDYVMEADSERVASLPLIDKLMVLSLRMRTSDKKLREMKTGEDLFIYGVNRRFIGNEGVRASELGEIILHPDRATAKVLRNGQEIPMQFKFLKEDGKWKFDVKYMLVNTGYGLQQVIVQKGISEEEYVKELLTNINMSSDIPADIWEPVGK